MNEQQIFNIGIALLSTLGGWMIRIIFESIKELQLRNTDLSQKLASVELVVAGQYAKKDDVDKLATALFSKLDRIEDKLDKKVDK